MGGPIFHFIDFSLSNVIWPSYFTTGLWNHWSSWFMSGILSILSSIWIWIFPLIYLFSFLFLSYPTRFIHFFNNLYLLFESSLFFLLRNNIYWIWSRIYRSFIFAFRNNLLQFISSLLSIWFRNNDSTRVFLFPFPLFFMSNYRNRRFCSWYRNFYRIQSWSLNIILNLNSLLLVLMPNPIHPKC